LRPEPAATRQRMPRWRWNCGRVRADPFVSSLCAFSHRRDCRACANHIVQRSIKARTELSICTDHAEIVCQAHGPVREDKPPPALRGGSAVPLFRCQENNYYRKQPGRKQKMHPSFGNGGQWATPELMASAGRDVIQGLLIITAGGAGKGLEDIEGCYTACTKEPWMLQEPMMAYGHIGHWWRIRRCADHGRQKAGCAALKTPLSSQVPEESRGNTERAPNSPPASCMADLSKPGARCFRDRTCFTPVWYEIAVTPSPRFPDSGTVIKRTLAVSAPPAYVGAPR
jgi:hypothetical protein